MGYMEISVLPKSSLRIKGKHTTFAVDPQDKASYLVSLLLDKSAQELNLPDETVVIKGPGEYEMGGVKMTGTRSESGILYSLSVDGVDILIGRLPALDKMQHKLKEHNVVVALCNEQAPASFLTSLAANSILFYGDKAKEISQSFGVESVKQMTKYQTTRDKLPAEVETVLLASSV